MKVWKSPVFYLGVILLATVIAALLAPFVVDWNSYRAGLEDYGRKLTGREVTITGPISVRFFPWPRLIAEDVHIANAPGLNEPEFASAERIDVRMQLAGLLNGTIDVESIEIDQPVVALERTAAGKSNWSFSPPADLAGLLDRVKLDEITLSDATIRFIDRRRGNGEIALKLPEARLASPGIAGPWRLTAANAEYGGQNFDLSLNTGIWAAEAEAFRFSLHIAGADGSGPTFNFDGANHGDRLTGTIQIETATNGEGKTDAEGQLRPLVIRSKIAATFDALAFDGIEISSLDPNEHGTLISGSAKAALGARISAEADLSAPKLDLAEWAGARVNQVLREGGSLAVADSLLATLPAGVKIAGSLKVTSLAAGGETLENVELRMEANSEAIRVRKLLATLPGRSRVLFDGVFFPGTTGAELAGNLALESNDLRRLASWTWREGKDAIAKTWTGSRGRLKLQTEFSLTGQRFRLAKTQYEIDGVAGRGELSVTAGGRGAVDLRIDAGKLDIDNLIPGGIAAASFGGQTGLAGLVGLLVPHRDARDLRLTVQAGQLLLNGVEADDVTVDIVSGASGIDLKTIEIGSVGGAKLTASGLILDAGSGPDGSVGIDIKADDPRGLLRLLGLIPVDKDPVWTAGLGTTALKGIVTVKTRDELPVTGFDVTGRSGDFDVSASGSLSGNTGLDSVRIVGSAELKAQSSSSLARLAGLVPATTDKAAARLLLTGSGSVAEGFLADVKLEAYGSRLDFNGTLGGAASPTAIDGKLALRSTDVSPLFAAMGLPSAALPAGVMVLDSHVTSKARTLALPDLAGRFGMARVGGQLAFAPDGKITGNLDTGPLALDDVLAATFLAWNGLPPAPDASLAVALPLGLTGEIWIKPESLKIHDTFIVSGVQIGLSAGAGEIHMAMFAKDATGKDATIEIGSSGADGNRAIEGKLKLPVDLAQQLRLAGGTPVAGGNGSIELDFTAKGRSPGGALAALEGSGTYDIKNLTLLNISPEDFTAALAGAKDTAGLNAAFDALRGGEGLAAGDVKGSITVANGVADFLPFTIATPAADAVVKAIAEPAAGLIDMSVKLSLKARAGLPAMEISYAGPPTALARGEDKAELMSKLGYGMMQKDVAELERMQQEQLRLAAEEEKLREADEEKLQAYYAQRDEVQLRRRELKVHAEMRVLAAEKLRQQLESERAANAEINRSEIRQRTREIKVHRRLAKLAQQQEEAIETAPSLRVKPLVVKPEPEPDLFKFPVIIVPPSQE
ncbi:MAG: AsmA family protein [Rhizobiales bacterium]|nr:AsmA family protein [Hyphomicrobiales bacterium]